jgi:methylthioribose-1-phosphate isomerase
MKVGDTHYRSIWRGGHGRGPDHRPALAAARVPVVPLDTRAEFATAIRDMWVRGAPLIGATAAYGVAARCTRSVGCRASGL